MAVWSMQAPVARADSEARLPTYPHHQTVRRPHVSLCGPRRVNLAKECGDFVLRRGDGAWAYQLAVVTDDALMGVTEVTRGNDLLLSAAQQIYLYRLLGFPVPAFAHIPLIVNGQGVRLSKRDASLSMASLRATYTPEEIIGRIACMTGLRQTSGAVSATDLAAALAGKFSFGALGCSNIITATDF